MFNTEVTAIIALNVLQDISQYEKYIGCGKRTISFVQLTSPTNEELENVYENFQKKKTTKISYNLVDEIVK